MHDAPRLRGTIGRFQYLALGFGTMIGSAWVILLGDWLGKAGPGGTILGFLAGGVTVMLVGACYAELAGYLPEAGSEFIYARRVYGLRLAFAVGWFLLLYLLSVTIFEALAFAWIVETTFPGWLSRPLYEAFGMRMTGGILLVGIGGALLILALNYRGARLAVISHAILTYGFIAIVLCVLLAFLVHGQVGNVRPLFGATGGRHWWLGSGAIFAFCAYGLNGFQAIPHAVEERSGNTTLRSIGRIIVGSIGAAAGFYCLVVIAASLVVPWHELAVTDRLPMIAAARTLPYGQTFALILLLTTAASLLKAWNGIFMMAVRLTVAMARAGCLPDSFARLHVRFASPALAVVGVGVCNIAGIFLGKGAIEPITDMSAMVLTLTYVLCCATVLRMRSRRAPLEHRGRGLVWIGLAGSALMAACAFLAPVWRAGRLPLEWKLLAAWGLIGAVAWRFVARPAAGVDVRTINQLSDPGSPNTRAPS